MPRNTAGLYVLPAGNPVVTGTIIESNWANSTLSDVETALTDSLDRQGRGGMLAPLRLTDGTVGVPSLSFTNAPGTGLYSSAEGLHAAVDGVEQLLISSTQQEGRSQLKEAPLNGKNYTRKDGTWSEFVTGPIAVMPIGTVIAYSSDSAVPTGWLECDGSAVSRSQYSELHLLYQAAGYPYGDGDGVTTFNLPDLRGRTGLGTGTGDASDATQHTLGEKKGRETHQLTVSELPAHQHGIPAQRSSAFDTTGGQNVGGMDTNPSQSDINTRPTGNNQAHNNLQPSLVLVYLVKATSEQALATDTVLLGMSLEDEFAPVGASVEFDLLTGYDYEFHILNARPSVQDFLVMEYSVNSGTGGPWTGAGFNLIVDGVESTGTVETVLQDYSQNVEARLGYDADVTEPSATAIVSLYNQDDAGIQTTSEASFFSRSDVPLYRYGGVKHLNNTSQVERAVRIRWSGGANFQSGSLVRVYNRSRTARDTIREGHIIQDFARVDLPHRRNLVFEGAGVAVSDESGTDSTVVTVSGGSAGDVAKGSPFVNGDLLQVQDATAGTIQTAGVALSNVPKLDQSNSFSDAQFVDADGEAKAVLGVTETNLDAPATVSAWGLQGRLSARAGPATSAGRWHVWEQDDSGNTGNFQLQRWDPEGGPPFNDDVIEVWDDDGITLDGAGGDSQGAGTLNAKGLFVNGVPVGTAVGVPEAPVDGNSYVRRGSDTSWQIGYTQAEAQATFEPINAVSDHKADAADPHAAADYAIGPGTSTPGNLAVFAGPDGRTLADGGPVPGGGGATTRIPAGLTIPGTLTTGISNRIFIPVPPGQTVTIAKVWHVIESAASNCTCRLLLNGVEVPGLGAVVVDNTPDESAPNPVNPAIPNDGNYLQVEVTALGAGTPADLSFTVHLDYAV